MMGGGGRGEANIKNSDSRSIEYYCLRKHLSIFLVSSERATVGAAEFRVLEAIHSFTTCLLSDYYVSGTT